MALLTMAILTMAHHGYTYHGYTYHGYTYQASSQFCLVPPGGDGWSSRVDDAVRQGCTR